MKYFYVILSFIFFTACHTLDTEKKLVKSYNDSDITYLYIYRDDSISEKSKLVDSLMLLKSGNEQSLVLYNGIDSICKTVDGFIYLNVFKINNEKFAIIVDSATKVYKFNHDKFERILNIPCGIGFSNIKLEKLDINADSFLDILLKIPTGSIYGDACICLFYNPDKKTFIYDSKSDIANIELNLKEKKVESFHSCFSTVYYIEKYSFRKIEQKIYLSKTTDNPKYDNFVKVTKFDKNGNVFKVDTIEIK